MINSTTKMMGIIGKPLGHSLSPIMHNKTLEKMGLNYVYVPLEIEAHDLGQAVQAIRVLNMVGVNVTIPYKEKVIEYLDYLSPEAQACRAVNLIKNDQGLLTGFNTDGLGFVIGLQEAGVNIQGQLVLIGAGGAARAVGYSLAKEKVEMISILDLDKLKAHSLANFISQQTGVKAHGLEATREIFDQVASQADIIINCTPVGMSPNDNESPVEDITRLKDQVILCDLIYNPLETKFLSKGKARGLQVINGLPMFIHQGALTLKILTGQEPPVAYMKEVILNQMQS